MEKKEFRRKVKERLWKLLGDGYRIHELDFLDLNGKERCCLCAAEKGNRISCCIHMEPACENFQSAEGLDTFVRRTAEEVRKKIPAMAVELAEGMREWERIKEKLTVHLVNTDRNGKLLEGIPSKPFLNLSCIFYVETDMGNGGRSMVLVGNATMEKWHQNADSLYDQAVKNMEQKDVLLERMCDILRADCENMEVQGADLSIMPQMYVLHDQGNRYGAAYILTKKARDHLKREFQGNVYILPSSIHEWICVPVNENWNKKELLYMVKEINRKEVMEEDFLADNVYLFRREKGAVEIAA